MYSAKNGCRLFVEDDGAGFDAEAKIVAQDVDCEDKKGEHVGTSCS